MIRLVCPPDRSAWRSLTSRFRAPSECVDLAHCRDRLQSCRAVAFLGVPRPESALVDHLLRSGKHVLVAAEPCWDTNALEALSAAGNEAGVRFTVANPDRYLPSRRLLAQQIPATVAAPGLLRLHRWQPASAQRCAAPLGLPGPLLRDLDLALWLMGNSPDLVYSVEQPGLLLQVHLGFSAGMALIDFDRGLPDGEGYQALSAIGFSGAAYSDDHQNCQLVYRGGPPRAVRTEEGVAHLAALVQEFSDSLDSDQPRSSALEAWREVLAVVEAVKQSLSSKRAVALGGRR